MINRELRLLILQKCLEKSVQVPRLPHHYISIETLNNILIRIEKENRTRYVSDINPKDDDEQLLSVDEVLQKEYDIKSINKNF